MHEETEKRDQFVYELINDRFRLERQRTSDLDGKASSIIGFAGVIVSLQAGLGSFLLKKIPKTYEFYIHLYVLFLLGIIFLMCSILCGLKAYYVRTWKIVPDPEYLIEEYAKKDRSRIDILRIVSQEISNAFMENKTTNDDKAKFIRFGFIFLVLGITVITIFMCALLFI